MKIGCLCGETISDTTDALPNKAYLLADQDWTALTNCSEDEVPDAEAVWRKTREVYQCTSCGRLTFDDPVTKQLIWFKPEIDPRQRALGSVDGNAFRADLVATWRDVAGNGELFWNSSGDHPGGWEVFSNRNDWMRRYAEVQVELKAEGRLGSCEMRER